MAVRIAVSGRVVSFLTVLTISFASAQQMQAQIDTFYLRTNRSGGPARLSEGWTDTSAISCSVNCLRSFTNCKSFMYNPSTKRCTPGSWIDTTGLPPSEAEGSLYYTINCNSSMGFSVGIYGSAIACVGVFKPKLNYTSADAACRSKGAYLMSIKTMDKLMILKQIWNATSTWIGCDALQEKGVYRWKEDGEMLTNATVKEVFGDGEMKPNSPIQPCIDLASGTGKLADFYCSLAAVYACEISIP